MHCIRLHTIKVLVFELNWTYGSDKTLCEISGQKKANGGNDGNKGNEGAIIRCKSQCKEWLTHIHISVATPFTLSRMQLTVAV